VKEATVNYFELSLRYFPEESQGNCEKSQSADRTADLESKRRSLMFEAEGLCTEAQNSLAADQIKKDVGSIYSLEIERSMNL
jgi:hypothetical protein